MTIGGAKAKRMGATQAVSGDQMHMDQAFLRSYSFLGALPRALSRKPSLARKFIILS